MKAGLSSLVCPGWDFATIVSKAREIGFDGIELCAARDTESARPLAEVAADADAARKRLDDAGVRLFCLGASIRLESPDAAEVRAGCENVREALGLAGRLRCPFVRIAFGKLNTIDTQPHALSRAADTLRSLVPHAVEAGAAIVLENGGDSAESRATWFVLDSVSHPAVQACWNPCVAFGAGERSTVSIPRLGKKIAMVHVCDAAFDERGMFEGYRLLGEGSLEWPHTVDLLRGVYFDGPLVFHWPKAPEPSLPEPENVLPAALAYLRERIAERKEPLSAYRKDKYAPKYG